MITKRLLTLQLVLVAGFGSIFLLPHASKSMPAGIAMQLPGVIEEWIGHDADVTAREREVLAKDTQFARKVYSNLAGDEIYVSIVMSGDDMTNSIHRPERCLPAQGWNVEASSKRVVPIKGGKSLDLMKLRNVRLVETRDKRQATVSNLNYYWFVGYDDMTASHLTRTGIDVRDRILHGYNQRWAYVTVAAIVTEGLARPGRTEEQTTAMLETFIQELVPELKRPDGTPLL